MSAGDSPSVEPWSMFVSASVPNAARWDGPYDFFAITDAVVATARAVLTGGGSLVSAAHPTVAPLLLYVARELAAAENQARPAVHVYQSELFSEMLPQETHTLARNGLALLRWTPAVSGESPEPGHWDKSLGAMRETMLLETQPDAAIFIGGMEGINAEFHLFRSMFPDRPTYALGRPGGAAAGLVSDSPPSLVEALEREDVYPGLLRDIVEDVLARIQRHSR